MKQGKDLTRAVLRRIRVPKEHSAFIYALLEAYEGIAAYSTLAAPAAVTFRDLELQVPVMFNDDVNELIHRLGELVLDLGEVDVPGI
jgi:hypothetical protein